MNKKFTDAIRNKNFELNCTEVLIYQNKGMCLKGYGKIKINSVGTIYLDFICQKSYNLPNIDFFATRHPVDNLADDQVFNLIGKTLNGTVFTSKEFNLKLDYHIHLLPIQIYVLLSFIEFSDKKRIEENSLYLETQQILEIPANKINTLTSTIGDSTYERNETNFNLFTDDLKFRYVKNYQNKSFIELTGNLKINRIYDCLRLYYGLTTGCFLQFYYSDKLENNKRVQRIYSVNNNKIDHKFLKVIPTNIIVDNKLSFDFHKDMLLKIIMLSIDKEDTFNSIFEQWSRLWDASRSNQQILNLVLTTSIEGLLNDIYIPKFEQIVDQKLLNDIHEIKGVIKLLKIDEKYKQRLHNSIMHLKTITANKALNLLLEKDILKKDEVKAWKKLRNEVAHPKNKILDIENQRDIEGNFVLCLNLFNNLILQALNYEGDRLYFTNKDDPEIIEFKYFRDF